MIVIEDALIAEIELFLEDLKNPEELSDCSISMNATHLLEELKERHGR